MLTLRKYLAENGFEPEAILDMPLPMNDAARQKAREEHIWITASMNSVNPDDPGFMEVTITARPRTEG